MKRVDEREPAVHLFRCQAAFDRPVILFRGFIDLLLGKTDGLDLRAGQGIQRQYQTAGTLDLLLAGDEPGTGATRQQRNPRVNAEDFQHLSGVRKEFWRKKNEPERNL